MRKTFLVLLAMTMVATMAFAETQVDYDLSGEATATFGVNLDGDNDGKDGAMTGFSVSSDADLDITFVEESTEEYGEGDVYGWMEIEDFKFEVDDAGISGASGDVSAKVFLGPAYIVVATANTEVNEAEFGLNVDESIIDATGEVGDLKREQIFGTEDTEDNVVAVGFMVPELLTVELALSSQGDWTENQYNNYAGGIYTEATVAGFTIELDAVAALRAHDAADTTNPDPNDSESQGDFGDNSYIGLGVGYDVPLNDMLTLTPYAGLDVFNDTDNDEFDLEVIAGANVGWGGADDMEVFEGGGDSEAGFGIEVGYKTDGSADQDWLWVRLGVAEESGDDGFFPVIGAAALVEFAQGTGSTDGNLLGLGAELDADLGVVSPFFGLMYADVEDANAGQDAGLTLNLGTDINVVSATTFTVEYASGDLLNDADDAVTYLDGTYDYDSARGASNSKLGTITISTKVEY
ncbi:MAG: hypothetical protein ACOCYB_09645 [Alkalispirochaeta sp.]